MWTEPGQLFRPTSRLYAKIRIIIAGGNFIFSFQAGESYRSSHYLSQKADKLISQLFFESCSVCFTLAEDAQVSEEFCKIKVAPSAKQVIQLFTQTCHDSIIFFSTFALCLSRLASSLDDVFIQKSKDTAAPINILF